MEKLRRRKSTRMGFQFLCDAAEVKHPSGQCTFADAVERWGRWEVVVDVVSGGAFTLFVHGIGPIRDADLTECLEAWKVTP